MNIKHSWTSATPVDRNLEQLVQPVGDISSDHAHHIALGLPAIVPVFRYMILKVFQLLACACCFGGPVYAI